MSNIEQNPRAFASADDEIAALLPFYLKGGLDAADTARVEAWIAADARAEAALLALEEERGETVLANQAIAVRPGALGRLMDVIDAEPVPTPGSVRQAIAARGRGLLSQLLERFDAAPARLAWAAATLLLAVVIGQGAMLARQGGLPGTAPGYEVASGGSADVAAGPTALVSFVPGATFDAITQVLADSDASIIAGPRGAGVYEIRFNEGADGAATAQQRIAALTARRDIISYISVQNGVQ